MRALCLTNNPAMIDSLDGNIQIIYQDISVIELLEAAKVLIAKGHRLISHPLYGNILPDYSPYKSILLSVFEGHKEYLSAETIDKAILHTKRLMSSEKAHYPEDTDILNDLQFIDKCIVSSCISLL
ncbi:GrdX family protein [Anaeropeptidivorans aminofermentans]|uniref:GrdX family protein n=1 Tax=Anaeropeptidivorans aminofermentans TaxID=2934315 RepID=UPI00202575D1|nr:GrdX family protein [Anaeropeptidivorans aminofermentans]